MKIISLNNSFLMDYSENLVLCDISSGFYLLCDVLDLILPCAILNTGSNQPKITQETVVSSAGSRGYERCVPPPPPAQNFCIFMQFSEKNGQIIVWHRPMGKPGSAAG